ncbi:hypothetical protein CERZMDRAFT_86041 [Cercospora zeae-maydis SCOH1-5]|uniref:Uncharacterized protein n=1 Tax=Cercospora zeae-maydis SCOH1-5 TaxID=717836 RepID=A0A6A6FBF1_9PEZI|nr:hypothetical protein CERZMDRAFT_86041 [Cercospora zeae-maydis SCOH1-5]
MAWHNPKASTAPPLIRLILVQKTLIPSTTGSRQIGGAMRFSIQLPYYFPISLLGSHHLSNRDGVLTPNSISNSLLDAGDRSYEPSTLAERYVWPIHVLRPGPKVYRDFTCKAAALPRPASECPMAISMPVMPPWVAIGGLLS